MAANTYFTTYYLPSDVNRTFSNLEYELYEQRQRASRKIDEWARDVLDKVNKHAREQKEFLDLYYEEQKRSLQQSKSEHMNTANTHYYNNEMEKLKTLVESCRSLKYDLEIEFDYENEPIPFIYCMTKEQFEQKKRSNSNTKTSTNISAGTSPATNTHREINVHKELNTSSSSNQTTTDREKPNSQPSRVTSDSTSGRTKGVDFDRNTENITKDNVETKCPVCFMIYPYSMNEYQRQLHVSEHLGDRY